MPLNTKKYTYSLTGIIFNSLNQKFNKNKESAKSAFILRVSSHLIFPLDTSVLAVNRTRFEGSIASRSATSD